MWTCSWNKRYDENQVTTKSQHPASQYTCFAVPSMCKQRLFYNNEWAWFDTMREDIQYEPSTINDLTKPRVETGPTCTRASCHLNSHLSPILNHLPCPVVTWLTRVSHNGVKLGKREEACTMWYRWNTTCLTSSRITYVLPSGRITNNIISCLSWLIILVRPNLKNIKKRVRNHTIALPIVKQPRII